MHSKAFSYTAILVFYVILHPLTDLVSCVSAVLHRSSKAIVLWKGPTPSVSSLRH